MISVHTLMGDKCDHLPEGGGTSRIYLTTFVTLLAAVVVVSLILTGHLVILTILIGGIFFAALTYFRPLPAVAVLILFSTDLLKFFDLKNHSPYVSLGPVGRFNSTDVILLLLLGIAIVRLRQRRERPLFLFPLLLFGAMICTSFVLGLVAGTTDANSGLNAMRAMSGFLFYFGLAGNIDTRERFRSLVWMILILVVVSVGIQMVEVGLGERITTPTSVVSEYYSRTVRLEVEGHHPPYLWNRAVGYLFVGLFIALGGALWARSLRHSAIAIMAFLGFGIALMREWYVYIACGVMVLLVLPRERRLQAVIGLLLVLLLLVGSVNLLNAGVLSSSYPFIDVWIARIESLFRFQEEANYLSRVKVVQQMMDMFREAPLFGHGPGSLSALAPRADCCFSDVGMPNTLVEYGFFGWGAIVVIIAVFLFRGYTLLRSMPLSLDQGYVAGLLGGWFGIIVAYLSWINFFTFTEFVFAVGLAMALLDRLYAFARNERGGVEEHRRGKSTKAYLLSPGLN